MPTIHLDKKRILELVGKNISDSHLKDRISFLGTDLEEITKDEIIVEIFPNRPDLLSEEGFARALSSFLEIKKGLIKYRAEKGNYKVIITKDVEGIRPFTACAVVKNLSLDSKKIEDIIKIQEKLHVTYGRNRKRCAIGIYPLEKIKFPITYTALSPEKIVFVPLDSSKKINAKQMLETHPKGKEFAHLLSGKKKFPVFIDAENNVMSVPPVINSESTGKITPQTKNVFVECSGFDFGVLSGALNMVVCALSDMGGQIFEVSLEYESGKNKKTPEINSKNMTLNPDYVRKYAGLNLSNSKIKESLEKMGFNTLENKGLLEVHVPCYRTDIIHPIDLVEDVCIGYGYDNIPEDNSRPYSAGKEIFDEKIKRKIRELLVGAGLLETNSISLVNAEEQMKILNLKEKDVVRVKNSISSEYDCLRKTLSFVMLKNLNINKIHEYPQKIFEIGNTYSPNEREDALVAETPSLSVCIISDKAGFTDSKQILDLLFRSFGLDYSLKYAEDPFFIKGRAGQIIFKNKYVGVVGDISPSVINSFELPLPVSLIEINLRDLFDEIKRINN